jgi:hypothetical protein
MTCVPTWLFVPLVILALIGIGFIAFVAHVWNAQH